MRVLGVDLGTKRVGLALGEAETGIASPLRVLPAGRSLEETARAVLGVAGEYGATGIVIGLPLNMDDTEGPQAKLSREFAEAVRKLAGEGSGLDVYLHDERLSSHTADHRLAGRELTRDQKKARQDAVAAQVVLESFIAMKRNEAAEADG